MSHRDFCGYNPPPSNFKTFFLPKYEDRLKRLPNFGKMRREWEIEKRPLLIMLHLFADNFGALEKWMDFAYQVAGADGLGPEMDFYVDDLWACYIFNEEDFSFHRGDEGTSVDSPPLIYGVTSLGEVHFFGGFDGPKTPSLVTLGDFCRGLIKGSIEDPTPSDSIITDIDLATWNEMIYSVDEDLAVCFYNSQQNGTTVNDSLMQNLERLGSHLKQESVRLCKLDLRGGSAPKKFSIESVPALFFLPRHQKTNPVKCKYELGQWSMIRFVAENSSKELNFYNRRGHRRLHAELLAHMKEFFRINIDSS